MYAEGCNPDQSVLGQQSTNHVTLEDWTVLSSTFGIQMIQLCVEKALGKQDILTKDENDAHTCSFKSSLVNNLI